MAKTVITTLDNLENADTAVDSINNNFSACEVAIENMLSRDGTAPNEMAADLDMDGNRIINLPAPATSTEAATKGYVDGLAGFDNASNLAQAVIDAGTQATAAAASAVTAENLADALIGTSVTPITPSVASKVFTTQTNKNFTIGSWLLIRSDAAPTTVWLYGQITDYTTDQLTVDVQVIGTPTPSTDWTILVAGIRGATGAAGTNGTDFTSDAELLALSTLTATAGLVTQTVDNTFTTRNIAGTSNRVTVTNPAGVAGDPTLNTGTDVLHKNVTATCSVGFTHTVYDHGAKSGTAAITPLPSLGTLQKVSLAASTVFTVTAPTAEEGMLILQITNTGAPTSITFSGFDKTFIGDTVSLAVSKVHWVYIYSIGTMQVMQLKTVA